MEHIEVFGLSRKGSVRPNNEDRFVLRRTRRWALMAVADGAGGQEAGEVAATFVSQRLRAFAPGGDPRQALLDSLFAADKDIRQMVREYPNLEGMGSTCSAVYLNCDGVARFVHSGDSRLYLLRGGVLKRLTRDHSFLAEFIESGEMTEAEALGHPFRNVLDQCLGCPGLEPDTGEVAIRPGDLLLACSDGLTHGVDDAVIEAILNENGELRAAMYALLQAALESESRDNVTVAGMRVGG